MERAGDKVTRIEPDAGTKLLCRLLVRRLEPRARRGEVELRYELGAGVDVVVKELIHKQRYSGNELEQFDQVDDESS